MRDHKSWEEKMYPHVVAQLSKRIRNELHLVPKKDRAVEVDSLYIHGPVGSGKTLYAAWMFVQFNKRVYLDASNQSAHFINVSELIHQLKASFDDPTQNEHYIMNRYSNCDFLVLDDFGAERPTEWARSMLYLLVNRRYEAMLHTVFTSNYSLTEVAKRWGDDRVPNRIDQMCELVEKIDY